MYNCLEPPAKLNYSTPTIHYLPPTLSMIDLVLWSRSLILRLSLSYITQHIICTYIDYKTNKYLPVVVKGEVLSPGFCASDGSIENGVLIVNTQSRK